MYSGTLTRAYGARLATLLGTTSFLTMGYALDAQAQGEVAQADDIPETVLITGSLIRGTAAVGVPVTNLSPMDFAQTGALTTADLFRTFPAANVAPGPVATMSGANIERGTKVNLRGLDTGNATRSLMMIDGMRFPGQGNGQCAVDPSIIPALSMDHIDVLVDGASATYGSDAVGGVINIILKRNMDGAITQLRWTTAEGGKNRYLASAVWGRTWDGGQITICIRVEQRKPDAGEFPLQVRRRPFALGLRRPDAARLLAPGSTLDRRRATSGRTQSRWSHRRPGRYVGDNRQRLYQLLCRAARHRLELRRPARRPDARLGELHIQRRQFGDQRPPQPVRSLSTSPGTTRARNATAAPSRSTSG